MNGTIYLDNNATTRVDPAVVMAMMPFFSERYGNPSSMHAFGGRVHQEIENARAKVAALIHADPSEIIFTGSGSESDNQAIFGGVEAMGRDTTVITTRVEHPAGCSTRVVITVVSRPIASTPPKIAWLSDSLPLPVNMISDGSA